MKLVKPQHEILNMTASPLQTIERAGRTCYKSEDRITKTSAKRFCQMIKERGHHSVLEHASMSVLFLCDRGVSHEFVRHRLVSISQESTRYVNYEKRGCVFVIPPWLDIVPGTYEDKQDFFNRAGWKKYGDAMPPKVVKQVEWTMAMFYLEETYKRFVQNGWSPEEARGVLPHNLKTELVVTANLREWMHIFKLRCSPKAHPQMRELMLPLREEMVKMMPELFASNE